MLYHSLKSCSYSLVVPSTIHRKSNSRIWLSISFMLRSCVNKNGLKKLSFFLILCQLSSQIVDRDDTQYQQNRTDERQSLKRLYPICAFSILLLLSWGIVGNQCKGQGGRTWDRTKCQHLRNTESSNLTEVSKPIGTDKACCANVDRHFKNRLIVSHSIWAHSFEFKPVGLVIPGHMIEIHIEFTCNWIEPSFWSLKYT